MITFDFYLLHVQCLIFWVSDDNVAAARNTNGPEIPINHKQKQFLFFCLFRKKNSSQKAKIFAEPKNGKLLVDPIF